MLYFLNIDSERVTLVVMLDQFYTSILHNLRNIFSLFSILATSIFIIFPKFCINYVKSNGKDFTEETSSRDNIAHLFLN